MHPDLNMGFHNILFWLNARVERLKSYEPHFIKHNKINAAQIAVLTAEYWEWVIETLEEDGEESPFFEVVCADLEKCARFCKTVEDVHQATFVYDYIAVLEVAKLAKVEPFALFFGWCGVEDAAASHYARNPRPLS